MALLPTEPGNQELGVMQLRRLRRMGTLRLAAAHLTPVIHRRLLQTHTLPQVLVQGTCHLFSPILRTLGPASPLTLGRNITVRGQVLCRTTTHTDMPTGQIGVPQEFILPNMLGQHQQEAVRYNKLLGSEPR